MTCMTCGKKLAVTRETVPYRASGLSNVVLANIEVRRCAACGETYEVIPRTEALHAYLARLIATQRQKLAGEQIRYMRTWLGWDREEFAHRIDVQPETVSRWENGRQPMSGTTERLLRLMALTAQPSRDEGLDALRDVATTTGAPGRLVVRARGRAWELAPSPAQRARTA